MGQVAGEWCIDSARNLHVRQDTPSLLNIETYLGSQGFRSGKLLFTAQALDKIHTYGLVINILIKIKDVGLYAELAIIKRWAVSDIGNTFVGIAMALHGHHIYTPLGGEFIKESQVGRRETE